MAISFHPLANLGAEVYGVEVNRPLQPAELDEIAGGLSEHGVLVFHEQELTEAQEQRFAAGLGEIEDRLPAEPALGALRFGQAGAYTEHPARAGLLYAIEASSNDGDELFASQAEAYRQLPRDVRERIAGLRIEFESGDARFTHPLVIAHPQTRRPLLFCNPLMAKRIVGLDAAESRALIEMLCAALESPQNVYEHIWNAGDLVLWDNLAIAYGRADFEPSVPRRIRRTTIRGARPGPYVGS